MSDDKRSRLKQWLASGEARLEPLTFPQRELWEASPVPPNHVSNQISCLIHVKGLITPQDCEAAIQGVVNRQESLRTTFLPGKDRPLQMVRRSGEPSFELRELTAAEGQPDALNDIAAEIFQRPFNLVQGPVHRMVMCRRSADDVTLVLSMHHAVADGWTLGVFIQDLCAAYIQGMMGIKTGLPPVPMTYSQWGAAEREMWNAAELERRAQFWRTELRGTQRLWEAKALPSGASGRPERWVSAIDAKLGSAARELARRQGATLYSTLLTVFQTALSKWSGADDIVVGTPVANRSTKAVQETMGYCSGVVPVRTRVDHDEPFSSRLKAVHQAAVESFGNAMPFAELTRALGEPATPGRNPVFEVRFALQNHPVPEVSYPKLSARLAMRSTGTPRLDLACEITEEGGGMEVVWLYRAHLFDLPGIQELDRLFLTALSNACRSPDNRTRTLLSGLVPP